MPRGSCRSSACIYQTQHYNADPSEQHPTPPMPSLGKELGSESCLVTLTKNVLMPLLSCPTATLKLPQPCLASAVATACQDFLKNKADTGKGVGLS